VNPNENPQTPFQIPAQSGVVFLPYHLHGGGNPLVGVETANRQPPVYPVVAASRRLPKPGVGSEVALRMMLGRTGGQAQASFLNSPASDPNIRAAQAKEAK
jgi:hypothetical protein